MVLRRLHPTEATGAPHTVRHLLRMATMTVNAVPTSQRILRAATAIGCGLLVLEVRAVSRYLNWPRGPR